MLVHFVVVETIRFPASSWAVAAMRAGYLARAAAFGLIGYMAVRAAWHGGYPGSPEQALLAEPDEFFGEPLLWGVSVGAVGFAVWCMMAGIMDLDCRGKGAAGIFARLDSVVTGALYAAIAVVIGAWTGQTLPGGDEASRE